MTDSTQKSPYIATKPMAWGEGRLEVGDPVPLEAGRDYRLLERIGKIRRLYPEDAALASGEPITGTVEDTEPVLANMPQGAPSLFVDENGGSEMVTVQAVQRADAETADALGVEVGDVVVLVTDAQNAQVFVRLDSLLAPEAAGRLLAAHDAAMDAVQTDLKAATDRADRLEKIHSAIRMDGDPLPDDFPGAAAYRQNGLTTEAGVRYLASDPHGRRLLESLHKIGRVTADQTLERLGIHYGVDADVAADPTVQAARAQAQGTDAAPATDTDTPAS